MLSIELIADALLRLLAPLPRITGLMLTAPVLSAVTTPLRVRVGLALLLAWLLAPALPARPDDLLSPFVLVLAARELMVGLMIGLLVRLVIEAFVFAGQVIGLSMGLGFGEAVDPVSGARVPQLGQFYGVLATLLFLAMDGHLHLLEVLASGFASAPPGHDGFATALWQGVAEQAGMLFSGAMSVALPAVTAILVVNLGFGVMSRAAPGMNLFAVGFPTALAVGFVVIWSSLGTALPVFTRLLEGSFTWLGGVF